MLRRTNFTQQRPSAVMYLCQIKPINGARNTRSFSLEIVVLNEKKASLCRKSRKTQTGHKKVECFKIIY